MLTLGISLGVNAVRNATGSAPLAPITEIAADGWTATRRDTSNTARVLNQEFTINEPGFDTNGNATTHSFTMANYCRLREQGTTNTSATLSALSRTVFQGATAQGVVNNSTRLPVKPAILWDMPDVLSIAPGETIIFSALISSAHANFGSQIARWKLIISDHLGNSVPFGVSIPSFRACPNAMPGGTPIGYERYQIPVTYDDLAALTNSSNTDGELCTVNCEAIPWFGSASTIAKTSDKAFRVETGDGPLKLFKSATARRYGYISSGATGGTISTDAAVARLDPFPTLAALTTAAGATTDNLIVRVRKNMENLTLGLPAGSRPQRGFGYVIEPDEQDDFSATAGRIALPWDTNARPRNTILGGITDIDRACTEFRRILWTRTSASFSGDSVNNDLVFRDCRWEDAGSISMINSATLVHRAFHFDNIMNRTGATGGTLSPTLAGSFHRWFGCRITALSTTSVSMQTRALVGCFGDCIGAVTTGNSGSPRDNVHWCYSVLYDLKGSLAPVDSGSTSIDHVNRNSLVIIPVSTNVGDVFSLYSGEVGGGTSGCPQIVGHYEYYVGRELVCRRNGPYDISSDGARTLGIIDHAGAVYGGRTAEKGDLFPGMSTRTGTRNMSHGVDCEGQVKGSYDQFPLWAPGWGALWTEPAQNLPTDLGYVAWNSTTVDSGGAFVAGTRVATPNMDDYRPTTGGVIGQQQMKRQMNRFDLFGNLRSANGLPGVWATAI